MKIAQDDERGSSMEGEDTRSGWSGGVKLKGGVEGRSTTWPGVAWARSLGRAVSGGYLELQSRSARGGGTWALKSIGDGVQKAMRDCQVPVHGQCHSDSKLLRTRVDQGETTDTLSYVRQVDSNFIKPPKTAAANLRTARYDPILIQPNRFRISGRASFSPAALGQCEHVCVPLNNDSMPPFHSPTWERVW
ncbi:hypothetical protein FocTR4_00002751 [Fusarium oxysporum f. sp. cubense]|uniref:Uncharacterized protein n=1 Tax=Fusarium oxysporum f. sp. cubense TaxID=61366 RepID=A0A5C6TAW7_FUSOC|nr:hypothetical protein FocTR4_00002751 [Fusarium oxysporum f. sp. cubense]